MSPAMLKVPYHGRAVDVSAAFLSACHPKIAFITDSDEDPADPIVVKLLESMGTDVHSARDGDRASFRMEKASGSSDTFSG